MSKHQLERIDPNKLTLPNSRGIDVSVYANTAVPIEQAAVDELETMLDLQTTVEAFAECDREAFLHPPAIQKVSLTPDFHKARGIPVGTIMQTRGFVVPQAIGNDINCGMRLHLTNLEADQIVRNLDRLETECRTVYF